MMYGYGFGGGLMMMLFWLVVIVVLVVAGKYLFADRRPGGGNTARDLLDEAYARGEIGREEYEKRRKDLSKS